MQGQQSGLVCAAQAARARRTLHQHKKKAVRVVDVYHVAFAPGRVGRSAAGTRATL
jgi:hypothetical protein